MTLWQKAWIAVALAMYAGGCCLGVMSVLSPRHAAFRDRLRSQRGPVTTWAVIISVIVLWPLVDILRALRRPPGRS